MERLRKVNHSTEIDIDKDRSDVPHMHGWLQRVVSPGFMFSAFLIRTNKLIHDAIESGPERDTGDQNCPIIFLK